MTILNGKTLNLLDELPCIKGIEAFRLSFTIQAGEQVVKIVNQALSKLNGGVDKAVFHGTTDTRGHFNKEIL